MLLDDHYKQFMTDKIDIIAPTTAANYNLYYWLTHDEMQRAIREGVGHKYYPVFLTLAMTGMRPAELRGLQWGDVDLVGRTLYIQRIYNRRCILAPKTSMSTRNIVMSQRLVDCLRRYKRKARSRKWVFVTRLGEPVSASSTIRYWLGQFFEDLGIRYVTPYSFRHYFASAMMDAGVPLSTVQCYGGWCDGQMVLLYAARQGRRGMEAACALLDSDDF